MIDITSCLKFRIGDHRLIAEMIFHVGRNHLMEWINRHFRAVFYLDNLSLVLIRISSFKKRRM